MTKCTLIDSESKITDLIYVFDDFISNENCDQMIQWFHDNEDLHLDGVVNTGSTDKHILDQIQKDVERQRFQRRIKFLKFYICCRFLRDISKK